MENHSTTAPEFIQRMLDQLKTEEYCTDEQVNPDGSASIVVYCADTMVHTGETDCAIKITLTDAEAENQRNANMQQAYEQSKAELQKQSDIIESAILSTAGYLRLTQLLNPADPEAKTHDNEMGEAIDALLALKKALGLTSQLQLPE